MWKAWKNHFLCAHLKKKKISWACTDQFHSVKVLCQLQGSVYSGLASRANCGQAFPDGLCVSSFPWWVAVCRHSQLTHFVRARLHMYVYMHMCSTVSVTCQCLLHIWHLEWLGSLCFTATTVTWVWNRYQNKSQCWKLTLEQKTPTIPARGSNPQPFDQESGASLLTYIPWYHHQYINWGIMCHTWSKNLCSK